VGLSTIVGIRYEQGATMNRLSFPSGWRLASLHHRKTGRGWAEALAVSLRLAAVGLLGGVIWIHLHLWQLGYRHIPTIGPLFLAGAVTSLAVTAVLLVRPSRLVGLLALALDQAILVSVITSVNIGLFGFKESLNGPFVVESITLEVIAGAALLLWVVVDLAAENRSRPTTVTAPAHPEGSPERPGRRRARPAKAEPGATTPTLGLHLLSQRHGHDTA
jgi:hypothetical protein